MLLENEIYLKIDLFLQNKLEGNSLIDFEKELLMNKELQNKVASVKFTNSLLIDNQLDQLKSRISKDLINIPLNNSFKISNNLVYISILGLLASFGAVYLYFNQPDFSQDSIAIKAENKSLNNSISDNKFSNYNIERKRVPANLNIKNDVPNVVLSKNNLSNKTENTTIEETNIINNNFEINNTENFVISKITNPIVETKIQTSEIKQIENNTICNHNKIYFSVETIPSLNDYENGKIEINHITNGAKPYLFSIDCGINYSSISTFQNLKSGTYCVILKDKFGCISEEKTIEIKSIEGEKKTSEYAFSPSLNEKFKFPVEDNEEGKIQILSRTGQVVFQANLRDNLEWNGESNTGNEIYPGVYVFIIEFNNGKSQKGYVTLY